MAHSLILVRLNLGWEDVGTVRDYIQEMRSALAGVDGFFGGGAWKGVADPHARLVLFLYESPEATRRGLAAVGELPTLVERLHDESAPPDVKGLSVHQADGAFSLGLERNVLLSMSVRRAEPGYGPELVMEYEDIFGGLSMMSGYAGGLIGVNSQFDDEVVGLAAWKHERAFDASLPEDTPYEVSLYEPLGEA